MKTYIRDDNKDIIEDNVPETNMRTFMKTHKIELVKNEEKETFLILQMKTHIRDNHAEYRKIETSGLNPNRFEPKFCLEKRVYRVEDWRNHLG